MSITFVTELSSEQVIRPPEGVVLPEGRLQVTVQKVESIRSDNRDSCDDQNDAKDMSMSSTRDMLLSFAREMEKLNPDLPSDLAEQHDHYLYGTPKR